jgi:hypothetical protein
MPRLYTPVKEPSKKTMVGKKGKSKSADPSTHEEVTDWTGVEAEDPYGEVEEGETEDIR